jgi:hypothetical protein
MPAPVMKRLRELGQHTNGKLARRIDQASEQTIPAIAACPKDHGWKREKRDGAYWCFGANPDAKTYSGWLL